MFRAAIIALALTFSGNVLADTLKNESELRALTDRVMGALATRPGNTAYVGWHGHCRDVPREALVVSECVGGTRRIKGRRNTEKLQHLDAAQNTLVSHSRALAFTRMSFRVHSCALACSLA